MHKLYEELSGGNSDMPFHITITDNKTGEKRLDEDCNAILGAINSSDSAVGIGIKLCSNLDIVTTVKGAEAAISKVLDSCPKAKFFEKISHLVDLDTDDGKK